MPDAGSFEGDNGALNEEARDLGEPVVIAHFNDVPLAHLAAARLEDAGLLAMVEPSNASRGVEAPFTTRPLGIGVMVPATQAEAAYNYLQSAGLLKTPDVTPERLVLQARDAMWLALVTILLFPLAPIAYLWASSTRRELDRVRQEMPSEDHRRAWRRATTARWCALAGILVFVVAMALIVLPPMLL